MQKSITILYGGKNPILEESPVESEPVKMGKKLSRRKWRLIARW